MIFLIQTTFLICILTLTSCSKNDTSPVPPAQPTPSSSLPEIELELPEPINPPPTDSKDFNLSENLISHLIQEVRSTRLLSPDSSDPLLEEQKTRNLTTANTLNKVYLKFDSQNTPSLDLETQEGFFHLELEHIIKDQEKTYYVLSTKTSWYEDLFSPPKVSYRSFIELRGVYNNVAIIDLKRTQAPFESTVHIIYLKKYGELHFIPDNNSSELLFKSDLLKDSRNLLSDLEKNKTVIAHFYHVITEYEHLNSSQATRFSLFFNIYFSLHSHPSGYTKSGSIPLQKERIHFGEYEPRSTNKSSQAKNVADNINALRQGHIHSLISAEYLLDTEPDTSFIIEKRNLNLIFKMKNSDSAETPFQNISAEVSFP